MVTYNESVTLSLKNGKKYIHQESDWSKNDPEDTSRNIHQNFQCHIDGVITGNTKH